MEYKNLGYIYWAIAGGLIWLIDYWRIFRKPEIFLPSKLAKKTNGFLRTLFFILGTVGWIYMGIALSGPREPLGFQKSTIKVNDIYFVVDVSRSMLANDFDPNRLEAAKEKIKEFIKLRPTDRIGIIIFSEKIFTLLPLSTDLKLIEQMISEIKVGFLGSGTNIGDALGLSVARATQSLAENKIVILLTDGVSNVGNMTPEKAAEEAKNAGVKVYTIGIGGAKDAKIPVGKGIFGQRYQLIPGGSIDTKTLEMIADTTGGKSYIAQDVEALKDVFTEIEQLEKTEIESSGQAIYKELYYKYLLIALILLLSSELGRRVVLREVA